MWSAAARLGQGLAVGLVVALLCFAFVETLPGDQALRLAAARFGEDLTDPSRAELVRRELGLERPWPVRLLAWLAALAEGDLGRSAVSRERVAGLLAAYGARSALLAAVALALSLVFAVPIGLLSALHPGGVVDRAAAAFSAFTVSLPSFVRALALMLPFAVELRWFPVAGFGQPSHLVLPATTVALALAAVSSRALRHAVVAEREAAHQAFLAWQGLGLAARVLPHGVRGVAIPMVALLSVQAVHVIDGVAVVETVFAYPGLGLLVVRALLARDLPVIQGVGLVVGAAMAAIGMVADIATRLLDPRQVEASWRRA